MGIFSESALMNIIESEAPAIRESLEEGCEVLGSIDFPKPILENMMQLESLSYELEKYSSLTDDEILEEGAIDNAKDLIGGIITLITKGREEMVKESTDAAKNASDYLSKLNTTSHKIIKGKEFSLLEYRTETVSTGSGTLTTYYYKNPTFSNTVIPFNDILRDIKTRDKKRISELRKKYSTFTYDITKWTPTIVNATVKTDIEGVVKILAKKIKFNKDALTGFEKGTSNMKKNLDSGNSSLKSIMDDAKNNSDKESKSIAKDFSVFVKYQKNLYVHDMRLMHTNNLMILKQSREIKRIIDKYND